MSDEVKPEPGPLTPDYVRRVVEGLGVNWAVVIAGRTDSRVQFTTWGRSARDKADASWHSQEAHKACYDGPPTVFESFVMDAARHKERVEQLESRLAGVTDTALDAGLMPLLLTLGRAFASGLPGGADALTPFVSSVEVTMTLDAKQARALADALALCKEAP